jgi:ABC-type transport system substrate-binding protein
MRKFLVVAFLLMTAVLFFAQTPKKGGTLVIAHWSDPISFNPCAKIDDAGNGIYPSAYSANSLLSITITTLFQILQRAGKFRPTD